MFHKRQLGSDGCQNGMLPARNASEALTQRFCCVCATIWLAPEALASVASAAHVLQ